MLQFFGIILLLGTIFAFVLKFFVVKQDVYNTDDVANSNRRKIKIKSPEWMIFITNPMVYISTLLLGIFLILTPTLFFIADRGYNYLLVYPISLTPEGKIGVVDSPGIKWKGAAKIDKWQKFIDVKVVTEEMEYDEDELEGIMQPIPLRFIDQVTAQGLVSTRFELPKDREDFKSLAIEFRSMSNLVYNTIIPTVKEQLVQTAYMFAAQDYISGEAQSFRQTFEEQLKDGTYKVSKSVDKDTIYNAIRQNETERTIKEIQTKYRVDKVEKNNIPIRIPHELSENNIIVSQVIVDQLVLDPTFKQRLEKQRDESALRQLEQQKIETAKATQQRIIAEGERDKAAERVAQEKEQISVLIAKETLLKEEQTNKQLAQIKLETQRLDAQTIKVKADADAYEIRMKVNAGITPERKLEMELNALVASWAEIAKLKLPTSMFMLGGNGTGKSDISLLEAILGAEMGKNMLPKLKDN